MKGVFIAGTGTGVGKSWIGQKLTRYLLDQGISVIPQKPVESACSLQNGKLIGEDTQGYYQACKGSITEAQITPFRFSQICSPALASRLSQQPLKLEQITNHIDKQQQTNGLFIIEGAGGLYSPLTTDALNIDLAKHFHLPIILVAKNQLGCINEILLSLDAIKKYHLECIAIILNQVEEKHSSDDTDNINELALYTNIAIIENKFKSDSGISQIVQSLF